MIMGHESPHQMLSPPPFLSSREGENWKGQRQWGSSYSYPERDCGRAVAAAIMGIRNWTKRQRKGGTDQCAARDPIDTCTPHTLRSENPAKGTLLLEKLEKCFARRWAKQQVSDFQSINNFPRRPIKWTRIKATTLVGHASDLAQPRNEKKQ